MPFIKETAVIKGLKAIVIAAMGFLPLCSSNQPASAAYIATLSTSGNITLNIATGTETATAIAKDELTAITTCGSGYNISIKTSETPNLYLGGDSSAEAISITPVNGTTTLNTNEWGYSLTNNSREGNFTGLSTTEASLGTLIGEGTGGVDLYENSDTSGTDITVYYGVKVSRGAVPGIYKMASDGAIVYYMTMDPSCANYTIRFNSNYGSVDAGMTEADTYTQEAYLGAEDSFTELQFDDIPSIGAHTNNDGNTVGTEGKLWAFKEWNTEADGSGTSFGVHETINLGTNDGVASGDTVDLYAIWWQPTLADLTTANHNGTMQDMSPAACYNSDITTAATAPAATLTDDRDGTTRSYNVSKLKDSLCWMTTNLALGATGTDGPNGNGTVTLTSENTDLTSDFLLPAGTTTSNTTTTAARIRLTNNSSATTNGVYYSWAAAVASTTAYSTSNQNVTTSICPKNWDLPTNTNFTNLSSKSAYSSSYTTTAAPNSFLVNGGFTNGATFYQTSYSHYWTSTAASSSAAYGARVNSSSMTTSSSTGTTYGGERYYEKNIRCVASQGTATINYDGNGTNEYPVTGITASQENIEINTAVAANTGFSREGWLFNGWNTEADGTGTAIAAGAALSSLSILYNGRNLTLYAQWKPQYTIVYHHNCYQNANANATCTTDLSNTTSTFRFDLDASGNGSTTLGAYNYNDWVLTGWKIAKWTTNSDGSGTEYKVSSSFSVTGAGADRLDLYAYWVPVYSIQYDGNGASNTNGMGTTNATTGVKTVTQTNVGEGDAVVLLPSNFKRAGYGFIGWSTSSTATPTSGDTIYGPMETIDAPAYPINGTNIITMYAVWVAAETSGGDPVYLQDWNGCSSLTAASYNSSTGTITPGSIIALTDKRDDEVYAIAKLADGNCWMIENLRLEAAGTVGNNKNDSSVTNQSLAQGYGGTAGTYGTFVGLATAETTNFSNSTTSNSIYKSSAASPTDTYDGNGTLEDIGTSNYPGYRFPRYNHNNTGSLIDSTTFTQNYANASSPSTSGTFYASNVYSYGNYYTWSAAIADTTYYGSTNGHTTVQTSICPAGWHLPYGNSGASSPNLGGTSGGFSYLDKQMGGTGANQSSTAGTTQSKKWRVFPNNFLYSGYYSSSSASDRGSCGYYWSSSASNYYGAYRLILYSSDLFPGTNNNNKYFGFTVRCVAGS